MFRGFLSGITDLVDRAREAIDDVVDRITGRSNEPIPDLQEPIVTELIPEFESDQAEIENEALSADLDLDQEDVGEALEEIEIALDDLNEANDELEQIQLDVENLNIEEAAQDAIDRGDSEETFIEALAEVGLDDEQIADARDTYERLAPDPELENEQDERSLLEDRSFELITEAYDNRISDEEFYDNLIDEGFDPDFAYELLEQYLDYQQEQYDILLGQAIEYAEDAALNDIDVYTMADQLAEWDYPQSIINDAFDAYQAQVASFNPYLEEADGGYLEDELGDNDDYRKTVATLEEAQEWTAAVPTGKFVHRVDDDGNDWYDLYAAETSE